MFEFDLQRFDDEAADQSESAEVQPQESGEAEPLPEELNGLPEDIARETLAEWKATQPQKPANEPANEPAQDTPKPPRTEESVPYARFKEKVDEANQLKAQLAEYQRRMQQQPAPQPAPPPQPQPAPQQARITPEFAEQINTAITAEALTISGLTQKDVEDLRFVDEDDARLVQWNQAKAIAQNKVYAAMRQVQLERQQQAQQFFVAQQAAAQFCNDFAQKEMETEPNVQAIQNFAANEFFEQLSPVEKGIVAGSYGRVNQNIASPADMFTVKNYYERAKAVFLSRANSAKKQAQTPAQNSQQAANLPRSDRLKGGAEQAGGQLTATEIEKLLEGDFTKLDPKKQNLLLGLS